MHLTHFFVNKGYHPSITVWPEIDIRSNLACDFIVNLNKLHAFLHDAIADAQICYKEQADHKWIPPPEFPIDSEVFVLVKHIKSTQPIEKFTEKYLGPFRVISCPSPLAYELKLPKYLSRIHPVFHVPQLEPVILNSIPGCVQAAPPAIEVDGKEVYKIAEILDSKLDRCYWWCPLHYYVRWYGYEGTDDKFAWVATDELQADEMVEAFHHRYPAKPNPQTPPS